MIEFYLMILIWLAGITGKNRVVMKLGFHIFSTENYSMGCNFHISTPTLFNSTRVTPSGLCFHVWNVSYFSSVLTNLPCFYISLKKIKMEELFRVFCNQYLM